MGHAVGEARRSVEAVRRGGVRAGSSPISASNWEHVELVLETSEAEEVEHVSALVLDKDCSFQAEVFRRARDAVGQETAGAREGEVRGSWRPCGRGVELILAAEEDLGLEELVILYRRKRGSLVADETSLPDGLAQAWSPRRERRLGALLKSRGVFSLHCSTLGHAGSRQHPKMLGL